MQDNDARTSLAGKKPLLEVRNVSQRYQTGSGEPAPAVLDDVSLDAARRTRSSACSAAPAAANPRSCASSPGSFSRPSGEVSYLGQPVAVRSMASPWCFRALRCFPGSPCSPMSSLACGQNRSPRTKRAGAR